MAMNEKQPEHQQNVVHGNGNIVSGEFTGSQIINQSGTRGSSSIKNMQGAEAPARLLTLLEKELAGINARLENSQHQATPTDRDRAIEAVGRLRKDLPDIANSGPKAPKKLRQRVKELLGVLAPVAETIGGIAALEQILQHL